MQNLSRLGVAWKRDPPHPLLRIKWHRIVVDEGHKLGVSLYKSNYVQCLMALSGQFRWIVTGTPTTQSNTLLSTGDVGVDLNRFGNLMAFLRVEPFGVDGSLKVCIG